ncbi:hypothetical protein K474DRAFT_1710748 [Panus rudis PR-1116 ss-1]|nr:hypothetical protein K474DRAFT_1710748 [Panus rudis PR-1116 ss-1]
MSDGLAELGLPPAVAVDIISQEHTSILIYVSVLTVLVYDTILTFPQEFRCIWQRKWTAVTLLYAITRYLTILYITMHIPSILAVPQNAQGYVNNIAVLESFVPTGSLQMLGGALHSGLIQSLRVWAIAGKSYKLAAMVLAFGLLAPCIDMFVPGRFLDVGTIKQVPPSIIGPIARASSICSDLVVLTVTLYKTAFIVRAGQQLSLHTKYTSLLFYTGVTQFVLLTIFNILNIIFDVLGIVTVGTFSLSSQLIIVNEGVSAIIVCRLMLSLRSVHILDASQVSQMVPGSSYQSSVGFSDSIVGNLGAPVRRDNLSFNSVDLDDILEKEVTVYSDNPLQAALLDYTEGETELQSLSRARNNRGVGEP